MQPGFQDSPAQASGWHSQADGMAAESPADAMEAAAAFFRDYARERPEVVALWAFGVGFVLGWKLKPW